MVSKIILLSSAILLTDARLKDVARMASNKSGFGKRQFTKRVRDYGCYGYREKRVGGQGAPVDQLDELMFDLAACHEEVSEKFDVDSQRQRYKWGFSFDEQENHNVVNCTIKQQKESKVEACQCDAAFANSLNAGSLTFKQMFNSNHWRKKFDHEAACVEDKGLVLEHVCNAVVDQGLCDKSCNYHDEDFNVFMPVFGVELAELQNKLGCLAGQNPYRELCPECADQKPKCDPAMPCGQALTCVEGAMYPTICGPKNCDKPIGPCSQCPIPMCPMIAMRCPAGSHHGFRELECTKEEDPCCGSTECECCVDDEDETKCVQPGECDMMPMFCARKPTCPDGQVSVLTTPKGEKGEEPCCDQFECQEDTLPAPTEAPKEDGDRLKPLCDVVVAKGLCSKTCSYVEEGFDVVSLAPPDLVCSLFPKKYTDLCDACDVSELCEKIVERKACAERCFYAFSDPTISPLIPQWLVIDFCKGDEGLYTNLCSSHGC